VNSRIVKEGSAASDESSGSEDAGAHGSAHTDPRSPNGMSLRGPKMLAHTDLRTGICAPPQNNYKVEKPTF
jgi:hypothetical protein